MKKKPETLSAAATFETTKNRAMDFGLCLRCACQLAWGHQNGFGTIHPPCDSCGELIKILPLSRPNKWRTVAGRAARPGSWPHAV